MLLASLKANAGYPFHRNELWYLLAVSHIHNNIDLFDASSVLYFLSHQIDDSKFCPSLHILCTPAVKMNDSIVIYLFRN